MSPPSSTQTTRNEEPCKAGAIRPVQGKVRELRTAKGWTQEELARRVGCMPRTIQRIEAGECALLVTLSEVATALKMEVAILLPAPPPPKRHGDIELSLTLKIDPEALDQCGQLLDIVAAVMKLAKSTDIDVENVGSSIGISIPTDVARLFVVLMEQRVRDGKHVSRWHLEHEPHIFANLFESDPLNYIEAINMPQDMAWALFGHSVRTTIVLEERMLPRR